MKKECIRNTKFCY